MQFNESNWNTPVAFCLVLLLPPFTSYCLFSTQKPKPKPDIHNAYNAFWLKALLGFSFCHRVEVSFEILPELALPLWLHPPPSPAPQYHTTPTTLTFLTSPQISRHWKPASFTQMSPSLWGQPLPSNLKLNPTSMKFLTAPYLLKFSMVLIF